MFGDDDDVNDVNDDKITVVIIDMKPQSFGQIHFAIWINTCYNFDKYILQIG